MTLRPSGLCSREICAAGRKVHMQTPVPSFRLSERKTETLSHEEGLPHKWYGL